jgi:hypothetical protein
MLYMGISFGVYRYWGSPKTININTYIDNIRIFGRAIQPDEIFKDSPDGLLAYWTFQKTDKELAYDEINNLPLIMFEDFELINEEVKYEK